MEETNQYMSNGKNEETTEDFAKALIADIKNGASVSDVTQFINAWDNKSSFDEASRPLMKYLAENLHPHATAIVTSNRSELLEGLACFNTNEYIKDDKVKLYKCDGCDKDVDFEYSVGIVPYCEECYRKFPHVKST